MIQATLIFSACIEVKGRGRTVRQRQRMDLGQLKSYFQANDRGNPVYHQGWEEESLNKRLEPAYYPLWMWMEQTCEPYLTPELGKQTEIRT